jgi:hypothetical protein
MKESFMASGAMKESFMASAALTGGPEVTALSWARD